MNASKWILPLVLAAGAFVAGCATPAQPTAMAAIPFETVTRNPESVSIRVSGGSETSAAGASQISNQDFATALEDSIRRSGLFANIGPAGAGDYDLAVEIVRLQQPIVGFAMTVTIETNWQLIRRRDQEVIWRKAVVSSHTAKTSEAFAGVKRLRLATEGAARENIRDAITQMSALVL